MVGSELIERAKIFLKARVPLSLQERVLGNEGFVESDKGTKDVEHKSFVSSPIYYKQGNYRDAAHETWFRGDACNYMASKVNLAEKEAIEKYILYGWAPERPFILKSDYITAFGSCFARHVSNYLKKQGYRVGGTDKVKTSYVIRCGEGMVNTYAIAQQFQWAFGEREFSENLWYDSKGEIASYLDSIRDETREVFQNTDVYIITLGLSEVWYDKISGDVFWRGIPKAKYDPSRHGFRVTTVEENKQNLISICRLARKERPNAPLIFTLSPVPLSATFRPVSCITANTVSKSILRVAIDEFMRETKDSDPNVFYFPSYEIVKEYFRNSYEEDNRHVRPQVVSEIMRCFSTFYLK